MLTKPVLFLRSFFFALTFYPLTALYVLLCFACMPMGEKAMHPVVRLWSRTHRLLCQVILGQKIRIIGTLPSGQYLFICKHESMFETIDMPGLLKNPVIAAKQELLDIPGWGNVAKHYGMIGLRRESGASALRHLQRGTKAALETGRPICLFPEGTRVPHGERPPIKAGFAAIYKLLNLPVVPIAVDSGRLSPRNSFLKRPGIITYQVGEIVPPGLARAEAEERVHTAINALNQPE
ncbi:MAG: 1-acyl-sn-glycerol-3-phosphate acyltransferase [Sphingobium sp.]|nr:1-acyl-sn-glycerol-3-phosphate acyltransferase [Sphingobium sp.]